MDEIRQAWQFKEKTDLGQVAFAKPFTYVSKKTSIKGGGILIRLINQLKACGNFQAYMYMATTLTKFHSNWHLNLNI